MEQKTVTIPFDLETAKRINIGGIVGRIVTEKGRNRAEIVYEDNSSSCPLLVVIHSITVSADLNGIILVKRVNWNRKTRMTLMYIRYMKQECIIFIRIDFKKI